MALRKGSFSQEHAELCQAEDVAASETLSDLETQMEMVRQVIEICRKSIKKTDKLPLSISEIIRLFHFQREAERERPADIIEVRWIDPLQDRGA